MQFCLSCCFSVALFDFFFPYHFSFGKTHSESSGGSFFFPFTNRTHLLLFLFHVTSINITETSNRLCVWLSPLSCSLPAAQPASISVNGLEEEQLEDSVLHMFYYLHSTCCVLLIVFIDSLFCALMCCMSVDLHGNREAVYLKCDVSMLVNSFPLSD